MGYEMSDNTSVGDVCRQCELKQLEVGKPSDESSREVRYSVYFEGMIKTAH